MKKMNPVEFVQTTINSSNLSLNQWSKELSVSRQTIYNWLGNIHINVRKIYVNRILQTMLEHDSWVAPYGRYYKQYTMGIYKWNPVHMKS